MPEHLAALTNHLPAHYVPTTGEVVKVGSRLRERAADGHRIGADGVDGAGVEHTAGAPAEERLTRADDQRGHAATLGIQQNVVHVAHLLGSFHVDHRAAYQFIESQHVYVALHGRHHCESAEATTDYLIARLSL
jgi:hypothetical protein